MHLTDTGISTHFMGLAQAVKGAAQGLNERYKLLPRAKETAAQAAFQVADIDAELGISSSLRAWTGGAIVFCAVQAACPLRRLMVQKVPRQSCPT